MVACSHRKSRKVLPEPGEYDGYTFLEVRPLRFLRVVNKDLKTIQRQSPKTNNLISETENLENFATSTENSNSLSSKGPKKDIEQNKDKAVFLIHGVGGSADVWQSQLNYFSSCGYTVVAPDLLGHGLSSAPDDINAYHFTEIMADMLTIFDKFCKRDNVVVGHSYGTSFATKLAELRPTLVDRLILISGGGPTALAPQPGIFTLPICLLSCVQPVMVCGFKRGAFHKKADDISASVAFDIPTYVLSYIMHGQDWLEGDEEYHQQIHVPTLLIYGDKDRLVTLEEESEMEETMPNAKLEVIKDASHMVMIEYSEKVNELIYMFVQQESQERTLSQESIVVTPRGKRRSTSAKSGKSIPTSGSLIRGTIS